MSEDSADILVCHVGDVLRVVVERGDNGEDSGSGVGCELHVAQVDAIERGLAHAEDERSAFFQCDVGSALNEVGGKAVRDCSERSHRAGKDDHCTRWITATCDVGSNVGVGVLMDFGRGCAEEFFSEVVAAAELEFFRENAE